MTTLPNPFDDPAADGNSYRYHATGLPAGGNRVVTRDRDPRRGTHGHAPDTHRFRLDVERFMLEIEQAPLFLRGR